MTVGSLKLLRKELNTLIRLHKHSLELADRSGNPGTHKGVWQKAAQNRDDQREKFLTMVKEVLG